MTYSTLPPLWTFPPFQSPCHLTLPHTHGIFDPCTLRGISHLSTIHGIGDTQIWQTRSQALMLNHNAPMPVSLAESISLWLKVWWLHESQSHQNDGRHWTMEDGETLNTGHPTIYRIFFFFFFIMVKSESGQISTSRLRLLRQLWLIQQKYRYVFLYPILQYIDISLLVTTEYYHTQRTKYYKPPGNSFHLKSKRHNYTTQTPLNIVINAMGEKIIIAPQS